VAEKSLYIIAIHLVFCS